MAYSQAFPPKNIILNERVEESPLNFEKIKLVLYDALTIKNEDKQIYTIITTFPELPLIYKILLLIINLVFEGLNN